MKGKEEFKDLAMKIIIKYVFSRESQRCGQGPFDK